MKVCKICTNQTRKDIWNVLKKNGKQAKSFSFFKHLKN